MMFFPQKHEDLSMCHQHSCKELRIAVHECVAAIPVWQHGAEGWSGGRVRRTPGLLVSQFNPMGELQVQ